MLDFRIDKRTILIIAGIILVITIITIGEEGILGLLLTLPGVIIAMTFHEFAHAFMAVKLGDDTPKNQGRLNLNPLSHLDPLGIVMLIACHFGWGKPVEIDPRNFNGKYSLSASEALVALAGPLMNFILAIVFAMVVGVIAKFAPATFLFGTIGTAIMSILNYTIIVNIGLGVFNLIPIPPLDGSKILMHFLPYNGKVWLSNNSTIFVLVFIALWVSGFAGNIISPAITSIYTWIMSLVYLIF